jgi:hypothetical protein
LPNLGNARVTFEEHQKILAREFNPELHDYYQTLWHLGGSQTDMAKRAKKLAALHFLRSQFVCSSFSSLE